MSSEKKLSTNKPRPLKTPKTLRKSIILDRVNPRDFMELDFTYSCEQCSHFASQTKSCTFGYNAQNHLKENQIALYYRGGRMAFCRYSEID